MSVFKKKKNSFRQSFATVYDLVQIWFIFRTMFVPDNFWELNAETFAKPGEDYPLDSIGPMWNAP